MKNKDKENLEEFFNEIKRLVRNSGRTNIISIREIENLIIKYEKPNHKMQKVKTTKPEELVSIKIDELKKLGFMITAIEAGRNRWFHSQRVIYRIESISNPSPNSRRIKKIPNYHKIQMDKANNKIRLLGINAGYPHRGKGGNWIELKTTNTK